MQRITLKALSILLSLAMIISAFAFASITVSADTVSEELKSDEITFKPDTWGLTSANMSPDGALVAVTKKDTTGDKGFALKLNRLDYLHATKVTVVAYSNVQLTGAYVALGEYVTNDNMDLSNVTFDCVKYTGQTIETTDTTFTFNIPQDSGYNTLYFSDMVGFSSANSAVLYIKSITVEHDPSLRTVFKGTFNTGALTSGNLLEGLTWSQGQWTNAASPTYAENPKRIGIDQLVEVIPSSTLSFSLTNASTGASASTTYRYVLRAYDSSKKLVDYNASGSSGGGYSIGGVENNKTIDLSKTNLTKIAYIGVALYSNGDSITLTPEFTNTYTPSLTMTTKATTTAVKSDVTSVVTAPDLPDYSLTGYTFIGWKDSANNLYKAGSQITLAEDTTFTAVAAKVETQEGAGVRWSNTDAKRGLKFTTYISGNVDAAELKNYISPALVKTVISGNGKTVEVLNSSAKDGNNEFADESNSTTLVYHGSVTEYQSDTSMLTVDFTAQGVATVTYADGSTAELSSSTTTTRNMKDVTQVVYDVLKDQTTELAISKCALLKDVYGVS